MNLSSTPLFVLFYNSIDIFLIIAVRMFGFVMQVPILSVRGTPMNVKIGFVLFTTMLIFFSNTVVEVDYVESFAGYVSLLVIEFTVGFLLGFIVYLFFTIFYMAGQFIDYQIGFSMVSVFDPTTQTQVPITGNILYLVASAIFVVSGAFQVIVDILIRSYTIIPIGLSNILGNNIITTFLLEAIGNYFQIAMLIAIPIVGTVVLVDIAMGLLVKTVPQMNVFVVGAPIKLIVGIIIFSLTIPNLIDIFDFVFYELLDVLEVITKGLK